MILFCIVHYHFCYYFEITGVFFSRVYVPTYMLGGQIIRVVPAKQHSSVNVTYTNDVAPFFDIFDPFPYFHVAATCTFIIQGYIYIYSNVDI